MARHYSASQIKSKLRQSQNNLKQAINKYNREVDKYNANVKKAIRQYNTAVNNYNAKVRSHNATVRRNRQIINNELRRLNAQSTTTTSFRLSTQRMHQTYSRVNDVYYEGHDVTPQQDRILDLIEQEQAAGLVTSNYIENGNPPTEQPEDIELGNKLALVSEDLNNRWKGAIFSLNPNNPDATRHFCTSTREIFTEFLEIKAPDEAVFAFNPTCARTENGNATRREKIKYMMRNVSMDESVIAFVEEDIKNILELNHLLSGGTHGPAGKYSFDQLLQVKKRVEQGVNFLCEISSAA